MTLKTRVINHCTVITEHIPSAQTAAIGIWLLNGSRYETINQTGYSHFLEHLLFKATRQHSSQEIARRFEVMGGHVNAETGRELTSFHGHVPKQFACELLSLLLEMLTQNDFSKQDFELERDVVSQELAMLKDDPEEALEDFGTEKVWNHHSMGKQILGTPTSLNQATMETFKTYMRSTITTDNLCIVASGHFDVGALEKIIADTQFNQGKTSPTSTPVYTSCRAQLDIQAEQNHLLWLMPSVAYNDPMMAAYEIANHILAGGYDSRLYQTLREKLGLVYSIDSRNDHYSDTGLWLLQTNTEQSNSKQTIAAVQQTIEHLINTGPTPQELNDARQHLQSRMVLEFEDREGRMDKLAQDNFYCGRHIDLEEQLEQYEKVQQENIQSILANGWQQVSFFSTANNEDR